MNSASKEFQRNAMASFIQIAAVILLVSWCLQIVQPFIGIVMWGLIIAVGLHPLHVSLTARLGARPKLSATLLVLLCLTILMLPIYYLADSAIVGLQQLSTYLNEGAVTIPPPNDSVAEWPLIGERVFTLWSLAASNLEALLNSFEPQLHAIGEALLGIAGNSALGILQFIFSFLIAGALLVSAEGSYQFVRAIARKLSAENGEELTDMSIATIRSVAKGVLGVAIVQTLMSAIGLVAIGVPAAGLWSFLILILAIMQLPPMLILGPIAIWAFSVSSTTAATIFVIYAVLISASDSVLKPMLLGRGLDIPMLVILLGAIGGMMLSGIIGLFLGAVILAVGYKILMTWMSLENSEEAASVSG